MSYNRRVLDSAFKKWLEEPVYTSYGIHQTPRKYAFLMFCEDLRTFLKQEGYVFYAKDSEMAIDLARYIFRMQRNLLAGHKINSNPDHTPEDFDMYCHLYDTRRWEWFLDAWKDMDDFSRNSNAVKIMSILPLFAWQFVDISASGPTRIVDEMNEESDSDGEERPRVRKDRDPYLDDQANAANKYNRWD